MPDQCKLNASERERRFAVARARFEKAALEIAAEHRFGRSEAEPTEIEIQEESTGLVKEARKGE